MARGYPPEFRRRVLDLIASGRKVADVARDLGVSGQTIYNWRRQDRIDRGEAPGLRSAELAELGKALARATTRMGITFWSSSIDVGLGAPSPATTAGRPPAAGPSSRRAISASGTSENASLQYAAETNVLGSTASRSKLPPEESVPAAGNLVTLVRGNGKELGNGVR